MPPKRFRVVTIREDLYDQLRETYERKTKNKHVKPSFSAWLSELIWEWIQKEENLKHRE